jgi:hypothetical protein
MCVSSHLSDRKHQITVRFTGVYRIMGMEPGSCHTSSTGGFRNGSCTHGMYVESCLQLTVRDGLHYVSCQGLQMQKLHTLLKNKCIYHGVNFFNFLRLILYNLIRNNLMLIVFTAP